jgi:hypothetical protein
VVCVVTVVVVVGFCGSCALAAAAAAKTSATAHAVFSKRLHISLFPPLSDDDSIVPFGLNMRGSDTCRTEE